MPEIPRTDPAFLARIQTQLDLGQQWSLRDIEHLDSNSTVSAWVSYFAAIFAEICDQKGVDFSEFEENFQAFQERIAPHLAEHKYLLSERAEKDVGHDGVSQNICVSIDETAEGVKLTMILPALNGRGESYSDSVTFAIHNEDLAMA